MGYLCNETLQKHQTDRWNARSMSVNNGNEGEIVWGKKSHGIVENSSHYTNQ